jgi:hypothetical protein
MEPGRDGTQLGKPPGGGVLWRRWKAGRKIFLLGAAHAVGRLVGSWQECSCWATSGGLAHIGLYTAKPFPKRIESDQGHSRDNASAMRINSQRLTWVGDELVHGRRTLLRIERDGVYPEMWRVRLPDGSLTDMVNRTRAKDAAVSIAHRLLNMSENLSEAPPTAPNDFEAPLDLEATCGRPGARQGTGRKS